MNKDTLPGQIPLSLLGVPMAKTMKSPLGVKKISKYGVPMISVQCWIDEQETLRMDKYIQKMGISNRNAVMRKALKEFLDKHEVQ